jgi:anti-sigma B factor antagonist
MFWTRIDRRLLDDGIVVVDAYGRVTVVEQSQPLADTIRELLADGRRKIVVNLANVPFIDSLGIGDIVRGYAAARREGAMLKLCAAAGRVRAVFDATQLAGVIELFETEEEARRSFPPGPGLTSSTPGPRPPTPD